MALAFNKSITVLSGTTVNLATIPLVASTAYAFTAQALGRCTTGGIDKVAYYETKWTAKRFGSVSASLVGSPVPIVVNEDDSAWALNVSVSGSNVLVDFVGDLTGSVSVRGEISYMIR